MPRHPPYTLSILIILFTPRRNNVLHQHYDNVKDPRAQPVLLDAFTQSDRLLVFRRITPGNFSIISIKF